VLNEIGGIELTFVADTNRDRLDALSNSQYLHKYEDALEAISTCNIDAAIVVTPASTHRRMAQLCLESGAHVMVEKPLALSSEDAHELARLSKQYKRILYPGHIYAHNDTVRVLSKMVSEEALGKLRYVTCMRTGLGPVRADVNVLWDLVPHDLTILRSLRLDRPTRVRAIGTSFLQRGVEDVVFCTLEYEGGAIAHVEASWLDPYKIRRVTVVGSRRMALFDDVATDDRLKIYERTVDISPTTEYGEFKAQVRSGDVHIPYISAREPLRNMIEAFVTRCRNPNETLDELNEGLSIVSTLEALNRSMRTDGAPVRLELAGLEQYATSD
jgi:predicted dehydrogenase